MSYIGTRRQEIVNSVRVCEGQEKKTEDSREDLGMNIKHSGHYGKLLVAETVTQSYFSKHQQWQVFMAGEVHGGCVVLIAGLLAVLWRNSPHICVTMGFWVLFCPCLACS